MTEAHHQDTKAPRSPIPAVLDDIAHQIVDAAYAVHVALGPGLLEGVYETCLSYELTSRGLKVERQVSFPVVYRDIDMDVGLRVDMLVEGSVIVEVKSVDVLAAVHTAQVLTYLKLSGRRLGLLINFNVPLIRDGIKRIIR